MKEIVVTVEIWASSDPGLDDADVIFAREFKIGNFKIPLPDIISKLCFETVEREYLGHEFVGYKVLGYSQESE